MTPLSRPRMVRKKKKARMARENKIEVDEAGNSAKSAVYIREIRGH